MLDRKFVMEELEAVQENCRNRGVTVDFDQLAKLETRRKELIPEIDETRRKANEVQKSIPKAKDNDERQKFIAEGRSLREQVSALEKELSEVEEQSTSILRFIPNMSHPAAPIGEDDQANKVVKQGKTEVPKFDFPVKDHVELGEELGIIDLEAGVRVAGNGFYFLKRDGVLLELALQQYAIQTLVKEGFTPVITPDLALNSILDGVGYIPRGESTQIYSIENQDLSLIATAEITLGGSLSGQILNEKELPILLCGVSHCFRTEAGAHGRSSRGLYRVHQFTKIEMFAFTHPEQSSEMLEKLLGIECQLFDDLGIPYHVVDTATGDLGGPAYRKYDLEAWMPGREDGGTYGEVTSTSNCTDYQARRLNIRFKKPGEKGTTLVHTLNGTAIAVSRALIAILENYQQADGSVVVPEVLRPWVGKEVIEPLTKS
ncbi:Seryl-tRNA synthetase [Planctomycetales bacterium 10988]|nr:Seryl-tRNA synthetase [Planctomycetales bacterium 10988]